MLPLGRMVTLLDMSHLLSKPSWLMENEASLYSEEASIRGNTAQEPTYGHTVKEPTKTNHISTTFALRLV